MQLRSITSMLIKTARARANEPFMLAVNEKGTSTVRHLRFPGQTDMMQVREAVAIAFGWPCCGDIHVVQDQGARAAVRNDEDLYISLAWHRNSEQKADAWMREMRAVASNATQLLVKSDNPQGQLEGAAQLWALAYRSENHGYFPHEMLQSLLNSLVSTDLAVAAYSAGALCALLKETRWRQERAMNACALAARAARSKMAVLAAP